MEITTGLPARGRLLDPRPEAEASAKPIAEAVNIPAEELLGRLHELPPKHEPVLIADTGEVAGRALQILSSNSRKVALVDFTHSIAAILLRLWEPNPFLLEILPSLTPGKAIDLACGAGRDAVAIASHGWHVTAVDHLPEVLVKGRDLESRYLLQGARAIDWKSLDLEEAPRNLQPPYDLVTEFYYLDRRLLAEAGDLLAPEGSLIVETFTTEHRIRYGKPRSDDHILQPDELRQLPKGLSVRHYSEAWRHSGRHTARLWATKT